jgi:hypothetical protein
MLSLTLIFRNFHLAARGADRWRQFLNQLRSPQSSSDSPLEQAGSNRQYRVRRPRFRERGSCRLSLPQRRRGRDETGYHDDGGGLPRDHGSNPASSSGESANPRSLTRDWPIPSVGGRNVLIIGSARACGTGQCVPLRRRPPSWIRRRKDPSIFGGKPAQADPARSADSRLRKHDRQWIIAIRSCTGRVGCASSGST